MSIWWETCAGRQRRCDLTGGPGAPGRQRLHSQAADCCSGDARARPRGPAHGRHPLAGPGDRRLHHRRGCSAVGRLTPAPAGCFTPSLLSPSHLKSVPAKTCMQRAGVWVVHSKGPDQLPKGYQGSRAGELCALSCCVLPSADGGVGMQGKMGRRQACGRCARRWGPCCNWWPPQRTRRTPSFPTLRAHPSDLQLLCKQPSTPASPRQTGETSSACRHRNPL